MIPEKITIIGQYQLEKLKEEFPSLNDKVLKISTHRHASCDELIFLEKQNNFHCYCSIDSSAQFIQRFE